jgi:hypothetical protein
MGTLTLQLSLDGGSNSGVSIADDVQFHGVFPPVFILLYYT